MKTPQTTSEDPARFLEATRPRLLSVLLERLDRTAAGLPADPAAATAEVGRLVDSLIQSIAAASPSLFLDHIDWQHSVLARRQAAPGALEARLEALNQALTELLPDGPATTARQPVQAALRHIAEQPAEPPSCIDLAAPLADLARAYLDAQLAGDRQKASGMILDAVDGGTSVKDIYLQVFEPVQYEIGRLWQLNRINVAQEHFCTAVTQLVMSQLYPYIFSAAKNGRCLVATSAAGDLHEIGMRMVADFFEMDGWDTFYLGANTPADSVVEAIGQRRAEVLAVSATMGFNVGQVTDLIAAVRSVHPQVKILTGGYPFNLDPDLYKQVGADATAGTAAEAIALANRLLGQNA